MWTKKIEYAIFYPNNLSIYELAVFGLNSCPEFEDFSKNSKYFLKGLENLKKSLNLNDDISDI